MFLRKNWLQILVFIVVIAAAGFVILQTLPPKDPIIIYKAVDVETKPKPPPPGETYETGHWHGDEWHANDAHAPVEVATPVDAQIAQPVNPQLQDPANAQIPAPTQDPSEESTRTRTPQETAEIQRQWREWKAWEDKQSELAEEFLQVVDLNTPLLPKTPEEAERYQTDKEWQRKVQEATDKYDEVLERMQAHEANRVLPPPESFR